MERIRLILTDEKTKMVLFKTLRKKPDKVATGRYVVIFKPASKNLVL